MKRTFLLIAFVAGCFFCGAQQSNAVAQKIAQKMRDSLSLTAAQQDQLYSVNLLLHDQKMAVRQQGGSPATVSAGVQRVENTRDSLYRPLLSEPQYNLYLLKKKTLVSNN